MLKYNTLNMTTTIFYLTVTLSIALAALIGLWFASTRARRLTDLPGQVNQHPQSQTDNSPESHPPLSLKNPPATVCRLQPKEISLETLKQLIPIRNIGDEILSMVHRESEPLAAGSILFNMGVTVDSVIYLLEGSVALETDDGKRYQIESGTTKAHFPLSSGRRTRATAIAKTDVQIMRVPNRIMDQGTAASPEFKNVVDLDQLELPDELKLSGLVHSFCQHVKAEKLTLPSLPNVAIKLRQALRKDIGIAQAAKIIQLDPAIAAKLIQVANSPLYLTVKPAIHCQDAVNRLGLVATRNLVTSISLHQVFSSRKPWIGHHLTNLWKRSVTLSSLCFVLSSKAKCIDPDKALLAGLISDIGIVPLLHFAENFPRELFDARERYCRRDRSQRG